MQKMKFCALALICVAMAVSAMSATVYLNKNAEWSANKDAFSTASYWGDGSEVPNSANDYVVASGFTLRVPDGEATFAGNVLQIGEVGGTWGKLKMEGNGTKQTFTRLVLANGYCFDDRTGNKSETVSGPVTITAPESSPFRWSGSSGLNPTYSGLYFEGALTSESETKLIFADNGQPDWHVDLKGGLSSLSGTLEMNTSRSGFYSDSSGGTRLVVYPGSGSLMPGKLVFAAGTSLYPSDKTVKFEIGTLEMAAGSRLRVVGDDTGAHSMFTVRDSFVFPEGGGIILEVSGLYKTADTLRTAIFSAPTASGFTDKTFRTAIDEGAAAFPRFTLEYEDSDGIRTLYLVTKVVDTVKASSGTACMNSPSIWESGAIPGDSSAANHDFYANKWIKSSDVNEARSFVSSATLTLGSGATLAVAVPQLSISEFGLLYGSTISDNGNHYDTSDAEINAVAASGLKTIKGAVRTPWKDWETCSLVGKAGVWMRHDGELTGGGVLHLHNAAGTSADAYYELTGQNDGFFGAIKLGTDAAGAGKACLVFGSAASLGGACKAFRADALTLSYGAVLCPSASMRLGEATRGVAIEQDSEIRVAADSVFELVQNTSWQAGLAKSGAGTFALGGVATVPSGSESNARLTISDGSFKPLSSTALDGVSLQFESGSAFKIAVPAPDEAMRGNGISPESITLPSGGVAVSFEVDVGDMPQHGPYTMAIMTIPSSSVASVRSGLVVPESKDGFIVSVSVADNADGTSTILAKFSRGGLCIICR